jgi:hypothetical protein
MKTEDAFDTQTWPAPFAFARPAVFVRGEGGVVVALDPGDERMIGLGVGEPPAVKHYWRVPVEFEALVERPGLPRCQLTITRTTRGTTCRRLVLADTGEPLSATRIRIPFRELVDEVAALVGAFDLSGTLVNSDEFQRALATVTEMRPARGSRLSNDQLTRAAETYRMALRAGQSGPKAVAEVFHISRSSAGRWLVEARRRGLLGPARPGVAGEIE